MSRNRRSARKQFAYPSQGDSDRSTRVPPVTSWGRASVGALALLGSLTTPVKGETLVVDPDHTAITMAGQGCAPGGTVTARALSSHGSANEFSTFRADSEGR